MVVVFALIFNWLAGKGLLDGHFLEQSERKNLRQGVQRGVEIHALHDDGNENIDRHGDPDLRFHRIL